MNIQRDVGRSMIDPTALVANQGKLTQFRGAIFTGIGQSGIHTHHGIVVDYTTLESHKPQRVSLVVQDADLILDVITNTLSLVFDEEITGEVVDFIMRKATQSKEEKRRPAVLMADRPDEELTEEEDPNVQS